MAERTRVARRRFLMGAVAAGGALLVGWGAQPPRQRLHPSTPLAPGGDAVALNGWVAIGADGVVSVAVARSEMGQGVHTALPMLVAEELDVPMDAVRVIQPPVDGIYANVAVLRESLPFHPDDGDAVVQGAQWLAAKLGRELGIMFTGGSSSVRDAWLPLREAGAVARAMLVRAAARGWGAREADCRTEDGAVIHADGRRIGYGALAPLAARHDGIDAGDVRLKEPREFRLIGKPVARLDSRAKSDGSARFGIDARPAGMVYAALKMAPLLGAGVAAFDADADAVRRMPGVLAVVDVSPVLLEHSGAAAGVAVVAEHWW